MASCPIRSFPPVPSASYFPFPIFPSTAELAEGKGGREGGRGAKSHYHTKLSKKNFPFHSKTQYSAGPMFSQQMSRQVLQTAFKMDKKDTGKPLGCNISQKGKIIEAIHETGEKKFKVFSKNLHPIQQQFLLPLCKPYEHLKLTVFRIQIVNPDPDPGSQN